MKKTPEELSEGSRGGPTRAEEFEAMYLTTPPWDIGRPQPAFVELAEKGELRGRVLDVGCGTGEHALMAAELDLPATGIDIAPAAIAIAKDKAHKRGLNARFLVWDALELDRLGEQFDTVVDSGLFHVFDDDERIRFAESLRSVLVPGGRYFLLCFSNLQPGEWGPRRIEQEEIRATFRDGWEIDAIEEATMEVNLDPNGVRAWRGELTRA